MNIQTSGEVRNTIPVYVESLYCLEDLLADMLDRKCLELDDERAANVRLQSELQSEKQAFARYRHRVRLLIRGNVPHPRGNRNLGVTR